MLPLGRKAALNLHPALLDYGRFAAEREQAPSPQKRSRLTNHANAQRSKNRSRPKDHQRRVLVGKIECLFAVQALVVQVPDHLRIVGARLGHHPLRARIIQEQGGNPGSRQSSTVG